MKTIFIFLFLLSAYIGFGQKENTKPSTQQKKDTVSLNTDRKNMDTAIVHYDSLILTEIIITTYPPNILLETLDQENKYLKKADSLDNIALQIRRKRDSIAGFDAFQIKQRQDSLKKMFIQKRNRRYFHGALSEEERVKYISYFYCPFIHEKHEKNVLDAQLNAFIKLLLQDRKEYFKKNYPKDYEEQVKKVEVYYKEHRPDLYEQLKELYEE